MKTHVWESIAFNPFAGIGIELRLALSSILNAKHGQFTVLCAIVCSSWTVINMATSGRSVCSPLGRDDRAYVQVANKMACRWFGTNSMCFPKLLVLYVFIQIYFTKVNNNTYKK